MDENAKKMKDIVGGGQNDIATRLIDAQKELAQINNDNPWGTPITKEDSARKAKLEAEIALGMASTTEAERSVAITESEKSQIQLIIDKTNQKMKDAQVERDEIQKTYNEKKIALDAESTAILKQITDKKKELVKEQTLYKSLIEQRKSIEDAYFQAFNKNITIQMDKTREAIDLLGKLSRM